MEDRSHKDILRTVRRIEIATRRTVNAELAGRYHSVFKGQGMAFSEVRPYTPGDDIRHIDWNVTARSSGDGLFIKQFIEERELTVTLLVDLSGSGGFGTRGRTKRALLAELGALIAFSAIQNNDRVALILFTDHVEHYVPPRKGRAHVLRVIRDIVDVRPVARGTDIGGALAYLSRVQKKRAVCFVLSDFLDDAYESALKVALARHDVVAMRVLDPAELELFDLGIVALEDAESGSVVRVDSASPRVRRAYAAARQAAVRKSERRLSQLGCDLVDLRTDRDFVAPLIHFFRVRSARLKAGR